jgi:hypothetical protein
MRGEGARSNSNVRWRAAGCGGGGLQRRDASRCSSGVQRQRAAARGSVLRQTQTMAAADCNGSMQQRAAAAKTMATGDEAGRRRHRAYFYAQTLNSM